VYNIAELIVNNLPSHFSSSACAIWWKHPSTAVTESTNIYTNIFIRIYIIQIPTVTLSLNCRHLHSQDLIPCHSFPNGKLKLFFCLHKCCPHIITKTVNYQYISDVTVFIESPQMKLCIHHLELLLPFLLMELHIWEFWSPFSLLKVFFTLKKCLCSELRCFFSSQLSESFKSS